MKLTINGQTKEVDVEDEIRRSDVGRPRRAAGSLAFYFHRLVTVPQLRDTRTEVVSDCRLEVRPGDFDGRLLAQIGEPEIQHDAQHKVAGSPKMAPR